MLSIVIALILGIATAMVTARDLGQVWGVVCGIGIMFVVQLVIGLWVRRRVNRVNQTIQLRMQETQQKINRKLQQFQQRPTGNLRLAQQQLEHEQENGIRQALEATTAMERYYKWNLMLRKQVDTMRMILYFQLRDFAKVDELLGRCLLLDPRSIAIKLTRMYRNNDPGLDRFFAKKSKGLKAGAAVLPYSTYAWMLVKQGREQEALAVLVEARKRTDHPVVRENYERLANGKAKHFSNAGLGDEWYSLYLEEPKVKPQRMAPRF